MVLAEEGVQLRTECTCRRSCRRRVDCWRLWRHDDNDGIVMAPLPRMVLWHLLITSMEIIIWPRGGRCGMVIHESNIFVSSQKHLLAGTLPDDRPSGERWELGTMVPLGSCPLHHHIL